MHDVRIDADGPDGWLVHPAGDDGTNNDPGAGTDTDDHGARTGVHAADPVGAERTQCAPHTNGRDDHGWHGWNNRFDDPRAALEAVG